VALRNRVDPWGDLHAVPERGLFTGNRGCLVDAAGAVARHHRGSLWITCLTEFRGWHHPLTAPGIWTPLFFLDDAVALAAGHRPCALCRRDAYRSYRAAVTAAIGSTRPLTAVELNTRLDTERLRRGRGIDRRGDRRLWTASLANIPTGAVILSQGGHPHLVLGEHTRPFEFGGWGAPVERDGSRTVTVLTPPTSVAALRHGYAPTLHPSAGSV